ncbi:MAG: hypothetical protein F4Y41_08165, partial [Gammaproteobacteria bacterium]|nr:hypothetical protein [Gammaproteobacteria bacterium]
DRPVTGWRAAFVLLLAFGAVLATAVPGAAGRERTEHAADVTTLEVSRSAPEAAGLGGPTIRLPSQYAVADLSQTDFGEPTERLEVAASSDRGGTVSGHRDDASGAPGRVCPYWLKRQLHAFFLKAEPGDIPRCLAAGAELDMTDSEGLTPLHVAARYARNPDVLSRLIEAGADVETRTTGEDPRTALYFAARYNRSADAVQRLIDLGADVNARFERGVMPLHVAALHNRNPAVVEHLVERGANLDALAWDRESKCRHSVWSVARFNDALWGTPVYRRIREHAEQSALSVADTCPMTSKRRLEFDAELRVDRCRNWAGGWLDGFFRKADTGNVEVCLDMGASMTIRDRGGKGLLHVSAEVAKDPDILSRLVEAGADVMAGTDDESRNTPLHLAASDNPDVNIVARLIELGADVDARNGDGNTPLHLAASDNPDVAIVARLIELGADVHVRNGDGWQPLHRAVYGNQNTDVAALLIERGADTTTTVQYRRFGRTRTASFWDLARTNRWVLATDWYRELEAAEEARRLAELENQRKERERLAEEERREQERRTAEARIRQEERLAEKAARVAAERESCVPELEPVGIVGSWRNRDRVIAVLDDDYSSPLDAYSDAIPFLLAGAGEHADVEAALGARILRDVDYWSHAGIALNQDWRSPEYVQNALTEWVGVAALLRKNCVYDIADYVVVAIAFENTNQFRDLVFWETSDIFLRRTSDNFMETLHEFGVARPDVTRALEHVPHAILAEMSETGRLGSIPRVVTAAMETADEHFNRSCVDYFNAQSELREGQSLTQVQHAAVTDMCECFHQRASAKGYLEAYSDFTDVMADWMDVENVFSLTIAEIKIILGQCATLHGASQR